MAHLHGAIATKGYRVGKKRTVQLDVTNLYPKLVAQFALSQNSTERPTHLRFSLYYRLAMTDEQRRALQLPGIAEPMARVPLADQSVLSNDSHAFYRPARTLAISGIAVNCCPGGIAFALSIS